MSDLYNDFPSWGETGEYPQDGFFYEGGDQVNEKHMDALWNGVKEHVDNLNTAIRDRVRNLHGNVVLDQGIVASQGSGTREVDVTASNDGAYVSGQYTGAVSAQTTSHTANSGSSTRTDVVYLGQDGNVSKSEGTASAPADTLKIAEVDVATDDTISAVRNYARDHAHVIASENQPSGAEPGDLWQDHVNDREKVYQSGAWRKLLTDQDSATVEAGDGLKGGGSISLDGGSTTLNVEPADFAGSYLQDDGNDNLEVDTSSVATRSWVNSNADVPNADHADSAGNADQLDGNDASVFATSSDLDTFKSSRPIVSDLSQFVKGPAVQSGASGLASLSAGETKTETVYNLDVSLISYLWAECEFRMINGSGTGYHIFSLVVDGTTVASENSSSGGGWMTLSPNEPESVLGKSSVDISVIYEADSATAVDIEYRNLDAIREKQAKDV